MPTPEEIEAKRLEDEAKKKDEQKEPDLVSKDAYLNVSNDMHKYKNELKETKNALAQMQADKQAIENEKLAEQGRWEELYKQSQSKLDEANNGRQAEQDKFINYHKKNSVLKEIGGFKNDEYNAFIKVDQVSLNEDGSIDKTSLDLEVNRIKQAYPELLNGGQTGKLPNGAPQSNNFGERTYTDMSNTEKDAYKRSLLKKPEGL